MSRSERSGSVAVTEKTPHRRNEVVLHVVLVLVAWLTPLVLLWPAVAAGQEAPRAEAVAADPTRPDPAAAADSALDRCDAAAGSEDEAAAERAAAEAERAAAELPDAREPDALVIRAQVRTRCRIPFAGFMRQGALVEESNGLLERALSIAPTHLDARFTLGVNHYYTPAFLGRQAQAIAAFERVIADHGDRDDGRVATSYELLGELYRQAGRAGEAATAWRLGAEKFPAHEGLRSRVDSLPEPPSDPDAGTGLDLDSGLVYTLEPIVVEASGYSMEDPRTATRLTKLDVYTLPGGTADVMQTFRAMPGVTQVTDGSDLYVRGGDPAEAPIYVDGARLFNPGKFETLNGSVFGVLDPSTLRRAYFSSGGFSARYGNALSGIVDIETEGRPAERRLRVGANLTSLGLTTWQPLGDRAGLWSTGMLTNTGALLALHGRGDDYPTSPSAFQAMTGLVYEPRKGVTVKASALTESDETTVRVRALGYEGPFTSAATSRLATASLRLVNDAGTASLRLSGGASLRESGFAFGVLDRDATDRGLTARLDGELDRGRVQLRAGLEAAALAAERDGRVPAGEELVPGSPALVLDEATRDARHLGGYGEVEARVTRRLALIAGLRADALPGEDGVTVDPRLAAAYRLDDWTLRLGGGLFSQGRWRGRPDVPDAGAPNGVPLRARHLVAGVQREGAVAVRAEVYLKDYDDYEPDPDGIGPVVVDGRARGLDLLVEWAGTDVVSGWLTWSLLDATLELADGTTTPSSYDVTHTLTAVTKLALGDAWELGLTARYATGRPYTPVLGAAAPEPDRSLAPVYGPVLSGRYPDYRRLDARLTRFVPLGRRSLVLYLEGLNVLDRGNVMGYTYDDAYANPEPIQAFFSGRTLVLGAEVAF
jgi:vitamin B12 transporter